MEDWEKAVVDAAWAARAARMAAGTAAGTAADTAVSAAANSATAAEAVGASAVMGMAVRQNRCEVSLASGGRICASGRREGR